MKLIPTVIASPERDSAIALTEFSYAAGINQRDAVGFYHEIKRYPDSETSRIAVVFSGTVYNVKLGAFDIPDIEDKELRFRVFAHAAIGDFLDSEGLPEFAADGESPPKIECFSPHFQSWVDRPPASDEAIEHYLQAHVFWSWKYDLEGWELGPADSLRLHRPLKTINRLVAIGEGRDWTIKARTPTGAFLVPTAQFLRERRDRTQQAKSPPLPGLDSVPLQPMLSPPDYVFVDESRITDLRRLSSSDFDLTKVIALCEELNQSYRSQCYYAVAALTRTLLDHVPPLFSCRTFTEVANNYSGGKSFKDCMKRLDEAARAIADMHLHAHIRQTEVLPNRTQVNFSNEADVLLAEIIRSLSAGK